MVRISTNSLRHPAVVTPKMQGDMHRAMWSCCQNSGFTFEDFFSYMRHPDVIQWRLLVAVYLRKLGYSLPEIAAMFQKKSHAAIHNMLARGHKQGLLPDGWGQKGWKAEKTNA